MAAMKILTALLKTATTKAAPRSSAALKADLQQVDLPALRSKVEATEQARKELLLTGSDDQLRANATEIEDARLMVERAVALSEELQRQIDEAERRERAAEVEEQAVAAQRAQVKLVEIYRQLDEAASRARQLLGEAHDSASELAQWNRMADKTGQRHRRIEYVDPIVKRQLFAAILR